VNNYLSDRKHCIILLSSLFRVKSCVDGSSLEGVCSIRMYNPTDFEGDKYMIRWTEMFLVQMSENARR